VAVSLKVQFGILAGQIGVLKVRNEHESEKDA